MTQDLKSTRWVQDLKSTRWEIEIERAGDGKDVVRIIRAQESVYRIAKIYAHGDDLSTDTDRLQAAALIASAPSLLLAAQLVVQQASEYGGRPSASAISWLRSVTKEATNRP